MNKEMPPAFEMVLFGLFSRFNRVLRRLGLSFDEMFILIYIRDQGKNFRSWKIVQRRRVTDVLKATFDFSDSMVSKSVSHLLAEGLLIEITLSDSDSKSVFEGTRGRKALAIAARGQKKVDVFSKEIEQIVTSEMKLGHELMGAMLRQVSSFLRQMLKLENSE